MKNKITYRRIPHAAHTGKFSGWDLEEWDVTAEDSSRPREVPLDAKYHSGYIDRAGNQHWCFTRRAPLSPSTCEWCVRCAK